MKHISAPHGSHWLEDPEGDCPGGFYVSPAECPVCRAERAEARVKVLETTLRAIAAMDYRGNQPYVQRMAAIALRAEKGGEE